MKYDSQVQEAAAYIRRKSKFTPKIGMVLGSGLGSLADEIQNAERYSYHEIPNFPVSTVKGHKGQLVIGNLEGKEVLVMQGRVHYYEGYTMQEVVFPVRVMQELGIDTFLVTNASGGINKKMYPGALMIIRDHINLMGDNPLIGPNNDRWGTRFPDMLHIYDRQLIKLAQDVAGEQGFEIFTGVHSAVTGPNYETGAELKMIGILGADTVGMSTVPEVMVARHAGMRILGICAITDVPVLAPDEVLTHADVVKVANEIKPKFLKLMKGILRKIN